MARASLPIASVTGKAFVQRDGRRYSLPQLRFTRWLADAGPGAPDHVHEALVGNLFASLPIYFAGVINTLAVSAAIAAYMQTRPFIAWFVVEIAICVARFVVLVIARRAALERRPTPTDLHILIALPWSLNVGYGVFISLTSGDWIVATLACVSAAGMAGGICFRFFSAPRFAAVMLLLTLGPFIPAVLIAGQPLLYVVLLQIPLYLTAMTAAAYQMNKVLVSTMRAERENDRRARHDSLTGLANRAGITDAVDDKITAAAHGEGGDFAVLFLDLDEFKIINDTFGHGAGDRLLKQVADRLRAIMRPRDVVARLGGDEFVVLVDDVTGDEAVEMGLRIIKAISADYILDAGIAASIGVSVGIAMAPEHGKDVDTLLAVADAALYEAKSDGKSRCYLASPETTIAAVRRLRTRGATKTEAGDVAA
jgi:diguanylate cyclase (GGDEF)-like protein